MYAQKFPNCFIFINNVHGLFFICNLSFSYNCKLVCSLGPKLEIKWSYTFIYIRLVYLDFAYPSLLYRNMIHIRSLMSLAYYQIKMNNMFEMKIRSIHTFMYQDLICVLKGTYIYVCRILWRLGGQQISHHIYLNFLDIMYLAINYISKE